jgi:DNA mismatch repair protein MutS2
MDSHSLSVLEFGRVLDLVREQAPSDLGKRLLAGTVPSAHREEILVRLRETTQMRLLRERSGGLAWGGSQDITPHLDRLRVENAWIEGPNLVHIADFAGACSRVGAAVGRAADCPALERWAAEIPELGDLEREIRRCLTPEGEVRDDASEELSRLRRGIGRMRRDVVGTLERLFESDAHAGAIQDRIVTMRSDRYVIPVKAGGRGAVPGLVHDRSASGQTVFVEPQAVIEMNNALREMIFAEREETLRILRALAAAVRRRGDELRGASRAMAALEAIWARAVYADRWGMVEPELLAGEGRLELRRARHPLLLESLGERVVPVDLAVEPGVRTMVVTGPNTGGKTVVLKTAGLLSLMAQSGLHVPAEPGTGMSCFSAVLADIGDEQSIQQNLSTFSGHLKNLVGILGKARPGALVLLDELGAGTDPSEGAALGIAVLEEVQRRGALTLATTHHNAVKVFASSTAGVVNAAMEFDESTLRPTYRLLVGVPGRSQAFAIAERYGLDAAVIARARAHRTVGEERFDRLMDDLERERERAAGERDELAGARAALEAERRRFEEEAAKLRRRFEEQREKLQREARQALRDAERDLKAGVRALREQQSAATTEGVKSAMKRLERAVREHLPPSAPAAPPPMGIAPGDRVFVNVLQTWGVVEGVGEGTVTVVVGDKRVSVPIAEVVRRADAKGGAKVERRSGKGGYAFKVPVITGTELDLRGLRAEEALAEVERFIDTAVLNNLAEVTIIHGRGTGRLQEAVRENLAKDSRVASFAFSAQGEGGTGSTKVKLAT